MLLLACTARAEDKPQAYEVDAGFDTAPQSPYWYSEAVVALNREMGKTGLLLRAYSSLADYHTQTRASPPLPSTASNGSST